jgi:hypothetical protein
MLHAQHTEHRPGCQPGCDRGHKEDEQVPLNLRIDIVDDGGRHSASFWTGDLDHAIPHLLTRDQEKVDQEEDDDEMTGQGQHGTHSSLNERARLCQRDWNEQHLGRPEKEHRRDHRHNPQRHSICG